MKRRMGFPLIAWIIGILLLLIVAAVVIPCLLPPRKPMPSAAGRPSGLSLRITLRLPLHHY